MSNTILCIIIAILLLSCGMLLQQVRKARFSPPKVPVVRKTLPLPRHWPQIDLALIHSTSRGRYAVDTSGAVHGWPDSLHDSIKYLDDAEYVRVNKSYLVAFKVILAFEREANSGNQSGSRAQRVYRLVLNVPFNPPIYTTYDNAGTIKRKWEISRAIRPR